MLQERLKLHIESNFPFLIGKKILLACSGGLDSVALCHLMHTMQYDLALIHCNFSLRGNESDEDSIFVEQLAEKLPIPFFSETFDTVKYAKDHKLSTQMAARELRYSWFGEILTTFNYDFLLTAHHADDALETFLINLSRGSGLRGLSGIPEHSGNILRPLLPFTREEILIYAQDQNLKWREDSSNDQTKYLRNHIRHLVVPNFKGISDTFMSNFLKSQKFLSASEALVDDYMAIVFKNVVTQKDLSYLLSVEKLRELPHSYNLLYELLSPFGFTDFQSISNLLDAENGKQIFSRSHILIKERENLILNSLSAEDKINSEMLISEETTEIKSPLNLVFEKVKFRTKTDRNIIYVDQAALDFPLILRKCKQEDYFFPFGMKGKKKLDKFFKDEKVSLMDKEKSYVLCSIDRIIWVIGYRADDRFKINEKTSTILKISLKTPPPYV